MPKTAPLLLLLFSTAAAASIVWVGDFETRDLSQWDGYVVNQGDWSFVQSNPSPRQGQYAARIQLDAGDYGPSNLIRTEVGHTPASVAAFQNTERYYAWSSMASTDYPLGAFDHQLMFWEADAPIYQQEMSLHVNATTWSFATSPQGGSYQVHWQAPLAAGQWHDFILHVKWSLDPAVGFVELYVDGALVVPKFFMKTMHDSNGTPVTSTMHHALFLGSYRAGKPPEVVYLDWVREATSLGDVAESLDGGRDAGGGTDAGSDAGPGPGADGGRTVDGGAADAGAADASQDTGDGGVAPPVARGCGCGTGSLGVVGLLGLVAVLLATRRGAHASLA